MKAASVSKALQHPLIIAGLTLVVGVWARPYLENFFHGKPLPPKA